ncbi:helix-turn-helix domain-containing protein [Staphylococcus epidermidis]|uniref:helix-turn-helix domain-containing protein n=1 Tax=Staphylococcus TaxID=1279 RepID=UPI00066A6E8A|nr:MULTISPECIES: helix-turn-helix transcriptional regulator [Staphylococcus]DAL40293.1 MAG TPA_asm: helix-turn-helix domain protein [Bacteriophage sp.]KAB2212560.1 helix-turn-helix transcriptional regulator [Staphylococcus epidermidis]MBE9453409.1 helix-turn-helix transcriptional regulator [Staphylococcus epidermidis]MBF9286027.1 helix-turn-helix transcriptional regulator [Staphylococcus epidermidis]MBF9295208.1 helix-turn-helix transcriptional regulator [Staphylococcus epidermidis]
MDIDKLEVGKRIKNIRLNKSKNLREFGELISKNLKEDKNISDSIVSRWEKGVSIPSAKRLKEIADIGNVSVNYLLYGVKVTYKDIHDNINTVSMKNEIMDNFERFLKYYLLYSEYNNYSIKTAELLDLLFENAGYDITTLTKDLCALVSDKRFSFYQHGVYLLLNEDFSKLHVQLYLSEFIYNLLVQITLDYPNIYIKNLVLQITETKERIKDISHKKDAYTEFEIETHLADFINHKEYKKLLDNLSQLEKKITNDNSLIDNN